MGLGEPQPLSAYHGTGVEDLLDVIVERLPSISHTPATTEGRGAITDARSTVQEGSDAQDSKADPSDSAHGERWERVLLQQQVSEPVAESESAQMSAHGDDEDDEDDERGAFFEAPRELKLAVVGRPNVGKSSLINKLLDEERMVVHAQPGTTRDAVSAPLVWRGKRMLIADTAGIRRRAAGGEQREELDRMAVQRAKQMMMASHATLLMYDATEGLTRADKQVASLAIEHGKSCVIVPNKCDLLGDAEREAIARLCRGPADAVVRAACAVSVHTGEGLERALDLVAEAASGGGARAPPRLNELFQHSCCVATKVRALKDSQAGRIRILYVLQARTEVPTFVIHLNRQVELHRGPALDREHHTVAGLHRKPFVSSSARGRAQRRRDRETLRRGPTRSKRARASPRVRGGALRARWRWPAACDPTGSWPPRPC